MIAVSDYSLEMPDGWAKRLGLLPVPLYANDPAGNFIMLNGERGNFCLATGEIEGLFGSPRSVAWSSDVGHFINISNRHAVLYRWDKANSETVRLKDISNDLERFRRYLEADDPRPSQSVVAYVMSIFHRLRLALGESAAADESVRALLVALAAVADDVEPIELDFKKWGLPAETHELIVRLKQGTWHSTLESLRGPNENGLKPDPRLLMRHAAGRLFQEANYQVHLPPQPFLPGLEMDQRQNRMRTVSIGAFYTPTALARALVENAIKHIDLHSRTQITVFDPACGSGEFLREMVRQFSLTDSEAELNLIGFDLARTACDMTHFALMSERQQNPRLNLHIRVEQGDALEMEWPRADLVLTNPPFLSYLKLSARQRVQLAELLATDEVKQRPDLSMGFIAKACHSLPTGGVISTLLPSSLLEGVHGTSLLSEPFAQMTPRLVAALGDRSAFTNAIVDASMYVATKGPRDGTTSFIWSDHRPRSIADALREYRKDPVTAREGDGYSIYSEPSAPLSSLVPKPLSALEAFRKYEQLPRIEQFFEVRQGILTGNNDAFLITDDEWKSLGVTERKYFRPAIVNASIIDGAILSWRYVFYPYGKYSLSSEKELRTKLPIYYKTRLLPRKATLARRQRVEPRRWWLLAEPRSTSVDSGPKIVSTYFGTPGSFSWDPTGKFLVVQGYTWLPKPAYKDRLSAACAGAYVAILNSELFDKLLRARTSHVAGGQSNLSKRYVREIPIPDLFRWMDGSTTAPVPDDLLLGLIDSGRKLISGRSVEPGRLASFAEAVYEAALEDYLVNDDNR